MTTKSEGRMISDKLKWYALLALALWLAFSGVAAAEQLYVNESGWWGEGGAFNASTAPIQAAVDAAGAADAIYVWNGSYSENVNVYKRLTIEGEGADVVTVTAASTEDHVFAVTADYVNISGFAVSGATDWSKAGVYLNGTAHCNVLENNASGNGYGIYLWYSSSNTLANNDASNNRCGIWLSSSSSNRLTNNTVNSNNDDGIWLYYSSNNTLTNNTADSNNDDGIRLYHSGDNRLANNTANSNNGDGIWLSSSSGNTLTNNTANSNNAFGICLYHSDNNTLANNIVNSNNDDGILLDYASDNRLANNIVSSNNMHGIRLDHSGDNRLANNTVNLNKYYGIYLSFSSSNTLANNTANSNNGDGIRLYHSGNSTLANNTVSSNNDNGICLDHSSSNNITCNWVQNNTQRGIYLHSGSTNSRISHNNIISNGNYNTATGGREWQFYNNQPYTIEAKHNYWGAGMNNSTIDASIYDDEEGGWGEVTFYPFETEPVPCAPALEALPAFTTADAVIALQIAAGSRPLDLRWDVSGDKRVTSLDVLMILQAAADAIYL